MLSEPILMVSGLILWVSQLTLSELILTVFELASWVSKLASWVSDLAIALLCQVGNIPARMNNFTSAVEARHTLTYIKTFISY
jgi:hypothetical protein